MHAQLGEISFEVKDLEQLCTTLHDKPDMLLVD